ncbi:MAG: PilZ domain-containing protein [Deltaproteobacteria bacterium]|nr:PilZ domain-containing protein [Deltaproteobacteria bacterium]
MHAPTLSSRHVMARGAALVIGADGDFRRALTGELRALPMPVTSADSLAAAAEAIGTDGGKPRVVLIAEHEVDVDALEEQLALLRVRSGSPRLVPILFGRPPSAERRAALREVGAELALFGRFGRHALRFQVNRALSPTSRRSIRGERRAPMEWRTRVFAEGREKLVRCYTLSSTGGYFVTPRPWIVGSKVALELPSSRPKQFVIEGRIVYTHASGSDADKSLPRGMAVAFDGLDADLERVIRRGVAASQSALEV